MSGSTDLALGKLKDRVLGLERLVRRLVFAFVAIAVVVVVALSLIGLEFFQRSDARDYYNTQIKKLVCLVPPGKPVANQLRAEVGCGPYVKPSPSPSPTQLPQGSRAVPVHPVRKHHA